MFARHTRAHIECRELRIVDKDKLLGVRVGTRALPDLVAESSAAIHARGRFVFACANPHSLVVARDDPEFRAALLAADAVVADGVGCMWASVIAGVSVGPRITGFDYFLAVMATLDRYHGKAFFFGSRDSVLHQLSARIARDFPNVTIASLSPPFGPWSAEENQRMVATIRSFEPDALWVGMTAPKQEKWVEANARDLGVPVIGSIGAVFDYYAGATQRAPQWICDLGLEWLYRLPREPKRLWRRTFVSAPKFLWYVLLQRVSGVTGMASRR